MTLQLDISGAVASLSIDRPAKHNAMELAMWEQLVLLLDAAATPTVRVLVLRSSTAGLFCSGADIAEMLTNSDDAGWRAANQAAINRAQYLLARFPKPTIAFVDGDAVGGGVGLALACDIRVASPRARFGITPARLGLVYPLHDTKLLVDLVGPGHAKRLLFTGHLIDAAEALRIGLVESIADDADALIAQIVAASPASCVHIKGFVRRIADGQTGEDTDTLRIFADAFTNGDFKEGSAAFVEKRAPQFLDYSADWRRAVSAGDE